MEEEYFPEGHEDCDYMVGLSIQDVHLLYHSVQETIRVWPGAPARPVEAVSYTHLTLPTIVRV